MAIIKNYIDSWYIYIILSIFRNEIFLKKCNFFFIYTFIFIVAFHVFIWKQFCSISCFRFYNNFVCLAVKFPCRSVIQAEILVTWYDPALAKQGTRRAARELLIFFNLATSAGDTEVFLSSMLSQNFLLLMCLHLLD
jgi:hypothetical protein